MTTPHRWLTPPSYGDGDNIWGGQNDFAIYGQGRVPVRELFVRNYNARFFGARGDGVTDDTNALQLMLDTARLAGGGCCLVPPGVYLLSARTQPVNGTSACLWIGANTLLVGAGPGATTFKMAPNQPNQTVIISNYQTISNTDTDVSFADFTLDGSAGAQSGSVDAQYGIKLFGVNGGTFRNVRVKDVYGTTSGALGPNGTPGEGFFFDSNGCSHLSYSQCRASSDGVVNTSSGFSANRANDVSYAECWASGLKNSMGFTHNSVWSIRHVNCWAAQCGQDGFHSEIADGVYYGNCTSGGTTNAANGNPYAASTPIGSARGFSIDLPARALISYCVAQQNTQYGILITAATGPVEIVGGAFANNTQYGIRLADAASVTQTTIKSRPVTSGNGSAEVWYNGATMGLTSFIASPPAVPATTVALTNPFPTDMLVYIIPNGATIAGVNLDGKTVGTSLTAGVPQLVRVRQGGTITLTYTVATPVWNWEAL